jgi:3',5'-cyclic AMP phosphodiesterase CpdA
MKLISRREFLRGSLLAFAGLYFQHQLPVMATNKIFKPFRFAFLPCLHLSNYRFGDWTLLNESLIILQDTVKLLNSLKLDFVVFGGDLVENRQKNLDELPVLLDVIYELQMPYYVIIGDREADLLPEYTKEHFMAEFRRQGFINRGQSYWMLNPVQGLDLIGLDSSVRNQMAGQIAQDQLEWLNCQLSSPTNNFKILSIHHPLLPEKGLDSFYTTDGFDLKNSEELVSIIDRYQNVDLAVSGHRHLNYITSKNNTHYVSCPSIVTYPCEFRIFEINDRYIKIENIAITYKQIIDKAKKQLENSRYAQQFSDIKPRRLLSLHKGDRQNRDRKLDI